MGGYPVEGKYPGTEIEYDQIRGRKPCVECGVDTSNYLAGRPFLMFCSGVCAVVFLHRESDAADRLGGV